MKTYIAHFDGKNPENGNMAVYTYDQLNRITSANSEAFSSQYQYDANGNILALKRWDAKDGDTGTGKEVTNIEYAYNFGNPNTHRYAKLDDYSPTMPAFDQRQANNEKLGKFLKKASNRLQTNKLHQVEGNLDISYQYDEIGNLTQSTEDEDIDNDPNTPTVPVQSDITWTVYGKVAQVVKTSVNTGEILTTISYRYDGTGNRIQKTVTAQNQSKTTHYLRDATGNILATYQTTQNQTLVEEFIIYGNSRIGTYKPKYDTDPQNPDKKIRVDYVKIILGQRYYELSNHLGNVLTVISDNNAQVVSANDYYPLRNDHRKSGLS